MRRRGGEGHRTYRAGQRRRPLRTAAPAERRGIVMARDRAWGRFGRRCEVEEQRSGKVGTTGIAGTLLDPALAHQAVYWLQHSRCINNRSSMPPAPPETLHCCRWPFYRALYDLVGCYFRAFAALVRSSHLFLQQARFARLVASGCPLPRGLRVLAMHLLHAPYIPRPAGPEATTAFAWSAAMPSPLLHGDSTVESRYRSPSHRRNHEKALSKPHTLSFPSRPNMCQASANT
jgi:hypothetical protein